MKRKCRRIFTLSCLCLCILMGMSSCLNDGDSDWFGEWQLREYRYHDGTVQQVDSIFYGFQQGSFLARCMNRQGSYETFYGYYQEQSDSITITLWEIDVNSESYKKFFDWGETGSRAFKVEEKSDSRMCWEYKGLEYLFRKY